MNKKLSPLPALEQGCYHHYKNTEKIYEVIGVARHSETLEPMVVYRALYGEGNLWVRPFEMFTGMVNVEGQEIPRFKKILENEFK